MLATVIAPALSALLSRRVNELPEAQTLIQQEGLDGLRCALTLRAPVLHLVLIPGLSGIAVAPEKADDPAPAVRLSLSLAEAAAVLTQADGQPPAIRVEGDAAAARGFAKLLVLLKPDLEEGLTPLLGALPAHQVARALAGVAEAVGRAGDQIAETLGAWLHEESGWVPGRHQQQALFEAIDTLRDDVARVEARLDRLSIALAQRLGQAAPP